MNIWTRPGLDNPIWATLTSAHSHFGYGNEAARRYFADVVPFAGLNTDAPDAYLALDALMRSGEEVFVLSKSVAAESALHQVRTLGVIYQMVGTRINMDHIGAESVLTLSSTDAHEMLELAKDVKPGPFESRTHETGRYVGIRNDGRLVAMAGERMKFDSCVEVSTVCVDQKSRGRGFGARLISVLAKRILHEQSIPFLHVFSNNKTAISLYRRLGFEIRRPFFLTAVKKR